MGLLFFFFGVFVFVFFIKFVQNIAFQINHNLEKKNQMM